uniref:Uncharacterized protein n=1 Tax=Guillardia theta TaxID=55529 RepID=A0A6U6BAI8_GUITH|mmetsp:Transcript_3606/g.12716  ORF Transcript_3606/g.12716 Transcript_3606/m.12716 type:complete len:499 (+) Transcript_3606:719-2215(+)
MRATCAGPTESPSALVETFHPLHPAGEDKLHLQDPYFHSFTCHAQSLLVLDPFLLISKRARSSSLTDVMACLLHASAMQKEEYEQKQQEYRELYRSPPHPLTGSDVFRLHLLESSGQSIAQICCLSLARPDVPEFGESIEENMKELFSYLEASYCSSFPPALQNDFQILEPIAYIISSLSRHPDMYSAHEVSLHLLQLRKRIILSGYLPLLLSCFRHVEEQLKQGKALVRCQDDKRGSSLLELQAGILGLSDSLLNLLLLAEASRDAGGCGDLLLQLDAEGMPDRLVRLLAVAVDLEGEAAKTEEGEAAQGKVWWVKGFFDLEESGESFILAQMTGTAAETIALALKMMRQGRRGILNQEALATLQRVACSLTRDSKEEGEEEEMGKQEEEEEENALRRICTKLAEEVKMRGNKKMAEVSDYPAALFCYSFALLLCWKETRLKRQLWGNRSEVLLRLRRPHEAAEDALRAMGGEEEEDGKNSRRLRRAREMLATGKNG